MVYAAKQPIANLQQPLQNPMIPLMQECVDAVTEHQRLQALLKGELIKGLLPQSSVRADYVVQRIQGMQIFFQRYVAFNGFCLMRRRVCFSLFNGRILDFIA